MNPSLRIEEYGVLSHFFIIVIIAIMNIAKPSNMLIDPNIF